MAYYAPTLTFANHPGKLSPVNAPMPWSWTASFATSTADINESKLYVDLQLLNQNVYTPTVIETVGRFKVPPKGNLYVYDPSSALKTYVTFPYDSSQAYMYVNEATPFSLRRLCPETEGMVRYQLAYGLEYNPNVEFFRITDTTSFGPTMSRYFFAGENYFCAVGDVIDISVDSGLYQYWAGTASVIDVSYALSTTLIVTDQNPDIDLLVSAGYDITGSITKVSHQIGTFSNYYGYNGTRQYFEKDMSMPERYGFHQLSLTTQYFMTDWGYDINHPIPIRPYQGERARCNMDFFGNTTYTAITNGLYSTLGTYDSDGNFISVTFSALSVVDSTTGITYSQSCYTVAVFDNQNTIPIVDGYKYRFTVSYKNGSNVLVPFSDLWYVGYNPCGRYQNYRIKFLNKQGSWNYWNFNYDSTQTTNIERTEYKRPMEYDYTLLVDGTSYTTSKLRGQAVLSSKVYETFTMNSDWITEDAYKFLGQLVQSPEVYIYFDNADATVQSAQLGYDGYRLANGGYAANGTNIPIIITDTSYTYKTRNREQLFNLSINFKYAFDTNLQNQ